MQRRTALIAFLAGSTVCATPVWAQTDAPIRIGMLVEMSAGYAEYGKQVRNAVELFLAERGGQVAGRPVQVIWKDTTGPNPDLAARLARELVIKDKVDFLAGFGLTPLALAVAPIATEARVPLVIMNAAASSNVVNASPNIVRWSFTMGQVAAPLAEWAWESGIKTVYTMVAAYSPGFEVERAFKSAFEARGGKVVGAVQTPLINPEFGPYVQRVRDARPDAIFAFAGSGENGTQLIKAWRERELDKAGTQLMALGDLTDDAFLDAQGDSALGIVTSHHYSAHHPSPENRRFVAAWQRAYGTTARPNYYAAASWDGMEAIFQAVRKVGGKLQPVEALMDAFRSIEFTGPRGPIKLDQNRDIVQNVYIRRVERVDGRLHNVEFRTFANVADPGKTPAAR